MSLRCPLCESVANKPLYTVSRSYADVVYALDLIACSSCGFAFLANSPMIQYDESYLNYEGVVINDTQMASFRAGQRLAGIAHFVQPRSENKFLDIGIGDGLLLSLAEQAGYTVFGLDINPDALAVAQRKYGLRAEVQICPLDQAYPNTKFDLIHMNEVIEHVSQPNALLRWCGDHLTKDGVLVIQTGNLDSLAAKIKGKDWYYFRPVHVSYFSERTLAFAIRQAGFRVVRCTSTDWRVIPSLKITARLFQQKRYSEAIGFLMLFMTAIIPGVRGSILFYATA